MTDPLQLLFVCSRNRIRSLTAERLFAGIPGFQVRSVGTQPNARIVVNAGHIGWADIIFLMEKSHLRRIQERFPEELASKQTVVLHIPDEFVCDQPELQDEIWTRVGQAVPLPDRPSCY